MTFAELVQKSQHGDIEAYGALVERFQKMAFGYAYHLLGDFHLAQDATQDAFLDGLRHVAAIREPIAFPVWLRRVVFKHCDRLSRRKRFATVPLEEGLTVPDKTPLADEKLEQEEMQRLLFAALDVLTDEERAVTLLFAVHRYPQQDIGVFLEIPVTTVKNRFRSARRKLSERVMDMAKYVIQNKTPSIHEQYTEIQELAEACRKGDVARTTNLLEKHPETLDGPDRDERFPYPGSCLWSPLYLAAINGHELLVRMLLDRDANPVPYEVAAQYHHLTYTDWLDTIEERGYRGIVDRIAVALRQRYGPPVDAENLHRSVREGDIERARTLLRENPKRTEQVDAVGNTPLHWAVAASNADMAHLLLEHGSPVDARNGDGRTPAVVALFGLHRYWRYEEKPELLDLLLKHGAAYTPLIAATVGDIDGLRTCLREDVSCANRPDPCYRRPLSAAAGKGYTEIVRLLLEQGADPNAKEAVCQGGYSLHEAAWKGYTEIARLLLEYGAAPGHWVDSSGDAMFAAYHRGHADILRMLYAHGGTMELQVYAASHRIDVIAEVLRLQPSKADEVLPYGWNDGGSEELALDIMRLAIRYGARFEKANGWNLRWTVVKYPQVFRLLQAHGADPDVPLLGISGDMGRRYADEAEQRRAVVFLVEECGADVNCRDKEELTPLAGAARQGHESIAAYLLEKGANPVPDVASWAKPLYLAEKHGHAAIAGMLRQNGAVGENP
ncbi:MAG: sigma-70 family RNA polymerase sigma factor [candidate division Zixibacteria bacterium]|nr:sigma-70 family RNA polymerase sigma factor [candidate division Zixibacteria bacterium]